MRDRKIDQLASMFAQINNGTGPDLLGVCEIENRFVLDLGKAINRDGFSDHFPIGLIVEEI